MTLSFQIESGSGMAIVTCSGVLRPDDAREGAAALWKHPDWTGNAVVWDFREARFDLSSPDVRGIARFISDNQPETPPARVAFVAPSDVEFGLARMFEAYREDSRTDFRVFREYEEAVGWARSLDRG